MGNAGSKAIRKLRSQKSGLSVPPTREAPLRPVKPEVPLASENKNEAIERDSKDPHFIEKLSQLGPVRVTHPMQTLQVMNDVQHIYRSRVQSETEADEAARTTHSATKDRLLVSSLTELLGARKSITNSDQLKTLANRYHVDDATLERLARVVNTPNVDETTVIRTTDKHGEESLSMMAHWVDPTLSRV